MSPITTHVVSRIEKIKKRDGRIVDFDRTKIEVAISKACRATGTEALESFLSSIADEVIADLEAKFFEKIPGVEDVQDVVERKLAEKGLFEAAKAYILYRKEHQRLREEKRQELLSKIEKGEIKIKKRDGSLANFDVSEIERALENCCVGLEKNAIDLEGIIRDTKLGVYDGIPTKEINQVVVMAIKARVERDPVYSYLAARFLINDLYKEVLGVDESSENFEEVYKREFEKKVRAGVESGRLDSRMLNFDFAKLSQILEPERDKLLRYLGAQTLYDRYFLRNHNQEFLEVPQYFWLRIAMGLAFEEAEKEERVKEFYDVMSQLLYVPSTPTLLHSGTHSPQMSSCYLTTVEDDLEHIFKCVGDNAQLAKWSGGIGMDWTHIRGTGALIKSINVPSQGVVPFLKIVDATVAAINRSGKRRAACCVYLETWHWDIEEFIELRKNTGDDRRRTHDTNIANWVPDLFVKRIIEDKDWTLFSPEEVPDLHHLYGRAFEEKYQEYERKAEEGEIKLFKKIRAKDLWRRMINLIFETGHPWMTFKDPCNIRSPQDHVGIVQSSNLCTEITLNTSKDETAVCNLGSLNLPMHFRQDGIDKEKLAHSIKIAMRMLDNVIDLNFYPTKEARVSNLRHRPVGLGLMGLQDALYKKGLDFDSVAAVEFSDEIMEFISHQAILASSQLARERGAYETFPGSKWDRGIFPQDTVKILEDERGVPTGVPLTSRLDWTPVREHVKIYGMRNSNCMALAPTATISNISGCFPTVEPIYKNVYTKSNFSGEFTVINQYLVEDLKRLNLWGGKMIEKLKYYDGSVERISEIPQELKEKYKEAFEIDPYWVIMHAAYRGKWIDQSQSVNIFTRSRSGNFISDIYLAAWRLGLKTTYYLRTLGASAIEKSTLDINKNYESPKTTIGALQPVLAVANQQELELRAPNLAHTLQQKIEFDALEKPSSDIEIIGETCEACQ
ncbi:MAG: ribonucleoside-diphosphate reductase subunit alpha [Parcubacteria group bacterium]|nr:ribonucleoside-diphosphate reductase subunit alpha [Parcubacteria group bacterium]